jgi:serine/threonine protein kinase
MINKTYCLPYEIIGTPPYLAPEIINKKLSKNTFSPFNTDVFSLGITFLCLVLNMTMNY